MVVEEGAADSFQTVVPEEVEVPITIKTIQTIQIKVKIQIKIIKIKVKIKVNKSIQSLTKKALEVLQMSLTVPAPSTGNMPETRLTAVTH